MLFDAQISGMIEKGILYNYRNQEPEGLSLFPTSAGITKWMLLN